ncbi:glutathione S-transferase N-terminal domain-containing protein, partial [Acinetobacter baumannii]
HNASVDITLDGQGGRMLRDVSRDNIGKRMGIVLFEKGMDFEIRDVDLFNKPEDIAVMNPYGQVPILVERDLILYESNIINEYIDERFPHPQLMP